MSRLPKSGSLSFAEDRVLRAQESELRSTPDVVKTRMAVSCIEELEGSYKWEVSVDVD